MVELVPSLLRQELEKLAEADQRIDGRGQWDSRDITLETNCLYNAEGSAKVRIGNTWVLAGVKIDVGEPFPDTPNQGIFVVNAELTPLEIAISNQDHQVLRQ